MKTCLLLIGNKAGKIRPGGGEARVSSGKLFQKCEGLGTWAIAFCCIMRRRNRSGLWGRGVVHRQVLYDDKYLVWTLLKRPIDDDYCI